MKLPKLFAPNVSDPEAEAQRLMRAGEPLAAARLLEQRGLVKAAVEAYLAAGEHAAAGALLLRQGRHERAAELFLRAGDRTRSAEALARGGQPLRAAELQLALGNGLEAARLFMAAGRFERAAQLYEAAEDPLRASAAWEQAGDVKRAAACLERHVLDAARSASGPAAGERRETLRRAGELLARAGEPERALALLTREGLHEQAARLALELGRAAEAAELFTRAGRLAEAAAAHERAGDGPKAALLRAEAAYREERLDEAAALYAEAEDYYRAAEIYEALGRVAEAAAAYEAGGAWREAGGAYEHAGLREEAAEAFEHIGEYRHAAELLAGIGHPRAAALYEKAGDYLESGEAAARAGDRESAIALLQRVPADSEDYGRASERLAELFLEGGHAPLALERLQLVLADRPFAADTLALHYWLALAREALGDTAAALETFRRILAIDFSHRDVAARVARLTAAAAAMPADRTAAPAAATAAHPPPPPPPSAAPPRSPAATLPLAPGEIDAALRRAEARSPAPPAPAVAPPAPAPPVRAVPTPAPGPPAGSQPRFALREAVGEGPLGTVLRAEDLRDGRSVALRRLPQDLEPPLVSDVLADLVAASRLSHPNLVKVLGVADVEGAPCVISELVKGTSMALYLRSGRRLTLKRCHALGRALALVLSFVHGRGLVHGSLRPSNLFLVSGILKLADLGLAHAFRARVAPDAYRSPEDRLDVAGDVFSFGAVLYHLLTGFEPVVRRLGTPPAPPSQLVPGVPASFDRLLLQCLEAAPETRPADARELLQALDAMVTIA